MHDELNNDLWGFKFQKIDSEKILAEITTGNFKVKFKSDVLFFSSTSSWRGQFPRK